MLLQAILGIDDTISLFVLTLVFTVLSNVLARKFGEREKMKDIQKEINVWNKDMKEAQKANDEKKLKQLLDKNPEMMGKMSSMMMLSMKSLVITLPLFIVLFSFILPSLFPHYTIVLPFDIHFDALLSLNILRDSTYGAKGFFIVCAIPLGLAAEALLNELYKSNKK